MASGISTLTYLLTYTTVNSQTRHTRLTNSTYDRLIHKKAKTLKNKQETP